MRSNYTTILASSYQLSIAKSGRYRTKPNSKGDGRLQFHAALQETDPQQLYQRTQALANVAREDAERRAIKDAIRQLRVVQVEKLNYPDWKKK
jgi:hypothetical protein